MASSGGAGRADAAYVQLPDDNGTITVIRSLAFRRASPGTVQRRALLQAPGFVSVLPEASVPEEWALSSVGRPAASGEQRLRPPVREVGAGNVVLGGLLIHQVRSFSSVSA